MLFRSSHPTGTPAEGSIQVAGAPNDRSRMARITHGGKQRPFRAFARKARVHGEAAQFSASPWEMRASQKPPCLPYGNSRYGSGDSRAEVLRPQRGGWRDAVHPSVHPWQGAADFGRRLTGGGAGVKGAQPPAASFPHFLSVQEMGPPAGAGPGSFAAR